MSAIFTRRGDTRPSGLRKRRCALCSTMLLSAFLANCATPSIPEAQPPEPPPAQETRNEIVPTDKPPFLPMPGLTASERLRRAIGLLEVGRSSQAQVELQAYLAVVPDSAVAKRILFQIEAPLGILFPDEHFSVALKSDESLSSLSGRYLGEVLGFYGLARYNDIENPSHVTVGQTIKIPATREALAVRDSLIAPPTVEEAPLPQEEVSSWSVVEEHVEAGRYGAAIRDAEAEGLDPQGKDAAILARAYDAVARSLEGSATLLAGSRALRAGQLYLEGDQPREALEMFELALEQIPGSTTARAFRDEARRALVEQEYLNGLRAFQRRQLDTAIAHFDHALEIDPQHRNANINRAQAVELQNTTR